jgi:sugar lactone lactonase YvrE
LFNIFHHLASFNLSSTAQWSQNAITVAGSSNGTRGSSLSLLNNNYGIYIADDGILYVADTNNNRVVLIQNTSTTAIAVIGLGSQSNMSNFNNPNDVFVTQTSIYVMDTYNYIVQKLSRNLSTSVTVAGVFGISGNSTDMAKFGTSYKLFVDNYGNLFVSDYDNCRVLMFPGNSTSGTSGVIVAGTGTQGFSASQLNGPKGLFVTDNGVLYIADCNNNRIQKINGWWYLRFDCCW